MRQLRQCIVVATILACFSASAQQVSYKKPSGSTRVNSDDVSVSYGPTQRRPANYDRYYNAKANAYNNSYAVTPYILPASPTRTSVILGPVRAYSDEEYARLVLSTLSAGSVAPITQKTNFRSIVVEDEDEVGREYKRAETRVINVIDRAVMIVDSREEVRLRGVRMLSEKDPNEIDRFYAREAMRALRDLTQDTPVYIDFASPLRDASGTLLGTVFLPDGTNVNKLLLERGLGQLEVRDFTDDSDIEDLIGAEDQARNAKLGLFSRFSATP